MTFMEDVIQNGPAEREPHSTPTGSDGHVWYVPHHNPKKPAKIRVGFDGNAGPDLTNALIVVLCRFRREPVAIMYDIKQMFHQFNVRQEHREYLRLLWWEGGMHETQPSEYRMTD